MRSEDVRHWLEGVIEALGLPIANTSESVDNHPFAVSLYASLPAVTSQALGLLKTSFRILTYQVSNGHVDALWKAGRKLWVS